MHDYTIKMEVDGTPAKLKHKSVKPEINISPKKEDEDKVKETFSSRRIPRDPLYQPGPFFTPADPYLANSTMRSDSEMLKVRGCISVAAVLKVIEVCPF